MKLKPLVVMFAIVLSSSFAVGQDDDKPAGLFGSQEEYYRFMGGAKQAAVGNPELMAMIPLINDIAQGRPIGSTAKQYDSTGSELGLLSNKAIREEIEMVDDQYEDLKNLNSQIARRLGEQLRSIDFSEPKNAALEIRRIRDQAQEEINSVLLPHQVARLRQIRFQSLLRSRTLMQILTSDPMRSELDISDRQTEKLRAAEEEIKKRLAEKIAKLQEQAREELISNLNPSQQTAVKEMIGDAFDLNQLANQKADDGKKRRAKALERRGPGKGR